LVAGKAGDFARAHGANLAEAYLRGIAGT
jgi:hypothetical protein